MVGVPVIRALPPSNSSTSFPSQTLCFQEIVAHPSPGLCSSTALCSRAFVHMRSFSASKAVPPLKALLFSHEVFSRVTVLGESSPSPLKGCAHGHSQAFGPVWSGCVVQLQLLGESASLTSARPALPSTAPADDWAPPGTWLSRVQGERIEAKDN